MFRKIVTELAYSPALAGNLGYYVKQIRDDTSRRQIGLIFVLLAVTVQLFAALSPPESANANNPSILIDGGIQSIDDYLNHYDKNTGNIKDFLTSLGITRAEIESAKQSEVSSLATQYSWSMENPREEESNVYFFTTSTTTPGVAYYQKAEPKTAHAPVFIGSSAQLGGRFAIVQDSAGLLTEKPPASLCTTWATSPNTTLGVDSWFNVADPACSSILDVSLSARGISSSSSGIDKFHPSDRIAYTLSITNKTDRAVPLKPAINLEDALEYSRILDYGGGEYNFDTWNLSWPIASIEAHSSIERTLITQLLPAIPATARGKHVSKSYDCVVSLSFGNTLATPVECPPAKYIERLTGSLPSLPAGLTIAASLCLVVTSLFLYARSRQILTELYIIRHNHLGGF